MIVVDSSVWVATLVPDDVNHVPSLQWLEVYTLGGGIVVAPALLFPEARWRGDSRIPSRDDARFDD